MRFIHSTCFDSGEFCQQRQLALQAVATAQSAAEHYSTCSQCRSLTLLFDHSNSFIALGVFQEKGVSKGSLGCKLWPLDKHVDFEHQQAWEKTLPPAAPAVKAKDIKYNAKVTPG